MSFYFQCETLKEVIEFQYDVTCLKAIVSHKLRGLPGSDDDSDGEEWKKPATIQTGGRPKYVMSRASLERARSLKMSWNDIADSFFISRSTLFRRRKELGILDWVHDVPEETLDK